MPSIRISFSAVCLAVLLPHQATAQAVAGPLLTNDRWPRATTLEEWTADVLRIEGAEDASETEQAKVLFRWLRLFNRMATGGMIQAFEGEHGAEQYVLDVHKNPAAADGGSGGSSGGGGSSGWKPSGGGSNGSTKRANTNKNQKSKNRGRSKNRR